MSLSVGAANDHIIRAMRHPELLDRLDLPGWETLIRQGRVSGLLARIHYLLERDGLIQGVPPRVRRHLVSPWAVAEAQTLSVQREVGHIAAALAGVDTPVILLKGAAYVMAGLPAGIGRFFSDVDILVAKNRIGEVESALMQHGWMTTHHDAYDQRYYRQWMHELPPMINGKRSTLIDVHHTILPETGRVRPDIGKLFDAAVPLAVDSRFRVLAPCDMILHSATHLFHESELNMGLRDLVDVDVLVCHFSSTRAEFWRELVERAREVGLARPLYYALRYASRIIGTPVPASALAASEAGGPAPPLRWLMDQLYLRALRPNHATSSDWLAPAARGALYVRGHWLRMPTALLLYHLTRKALVRGD